MCGRYTLTLADRAALALQLGVPLDAIPEDAIRPRYNIAPLQRAPIVRLRREDREALVARWGLVNPWAKDAKRAARQINARAEAVDSRPAYRQAFQSRRCVVPADGFYEWTGPKSKRRPLWFHCPDGGLIWFAGLYEVWWPAPDVAETTFTILTTTANALVAPVHDRMPVILPDAVVDDWLFNDEGKQAALKALLVPSADDLLVSTPASPLVNSVRNEGPELLEASVS